MAPATGSTVTWTAPMQPGPAPVVVTASDSRGGTATANLALTVAPAAPAAPARRQYSFDAVLFDLDQTTLRPDTLKTLSEVLALLKGDAALRLTIEGHTCNLGTDSYNDVLGAQRADAVRAYLVTQGVSPDRLQTISYGAQRPKYDNTREETRRLNRRVEFVAR
jgi:outer membrane protein OmpA-like peptidoglycan-associated protein